MPFVGTEVYVVEVMMLLLRASSRFCGRSLLAMQVPESVLFSAMHGTVLWGKAFGDQVQTRSKLKKASNRRQERSFAETGGTHRDGAGTLVKACRTCAWFSVPRTGQASSVVACSCLALVLIVQESWSGCKVSEWGERSREKAR